MENKTNFIKDVVHGEIAIEHEWASEILRSREFARLSRIKQLGLTMRLFPNATHTRYAHSLGAYYLANQIVKQLGCFTQQDAEELAAAALLHDLGHGPHSHAFESYTQIEHEMYSKQMILDSSTEINQILIKHKINPKNVVSILDHNHPNPFLNDLISSQIDVDRMDYLQRDAQFTGACYGNIDSSMIIKWSTIQENKICFFGKAISSIENFLLARYHMYKQVSEEPKMAALTQLLRKMLARFKTLYRKNKKRVVNKNNMASYFDPWLNDKPFTLDQYIDIDDTKFEMFIDQMQYEKDPFILEAYKLYSSFANSDYKVVLYSKTNLEKYKKEISSKTKHPQLYIHKCRINNKAIYKKDEQPIWIYDSSTKKVYSLDQQSLVIKKLIKATKPLEVLVINNNI